MNVFITGGAGFIGSHLALRHLRAGDSVTCFDNMMLGRRALLSECIGHPKFRLIEADLRDLERVKQEIQGAHLVYHMAANSDISQGAKFTDVDLLNGTVATYNVLEAMRIAGVSQMIFASTSAIYGEASVKPTPESYGPLFPISFYGASKLACEGLCTAFSHNYGIRVWAYRFANIVGSNSTHGAIYDFVDRLKKNPKQLEVLGDGTQRKSYLHVSDCIDGMNFGFTQSQKEFQLFNLASQGVSQVRQIAESVVQEMESHTGVRAQIIYGEGDRGWRGDVPYTHLDGSLLESLGWKSKLNSDQAIQRAVSEIVKEKMARV